MGTTASILPGEAKLLRANRASHAEWLSLFFFASACLPSFCDDSKRSGLRYFRSGGFQSMAGVSQGQSQQKCDHSSTGKASSLGILTRPTTPRQTPKILVAIQDAASPGCGE
ncbi:hypothetical protein Rcae01_01398 [Novipirellula caenicola]|uniref:Uncharacterized protein n=1 Tax=Novipirellula caenicola TaxID=1536901 RepID=A0ABP9VL79_9BACT